MHKHDFFDLLEKYEKRACSKQEQKLFDDFCETLNRYPDQWEGWDLSDKERVRLEIYTKMQRRIRAVTPVKRNRVSVGWAVAASILILFGIGWYAGYQHLNTTKEIQFITKSTERGQRSAITLTDGTVMQLNAESSISFPEEFGPKERVVHLEGEAFFDVTKDSARPFIITTGDLSTTVLGTSFNIRAYPGEGIRVTVATGKVKVHRNQFKDRTHEVTLLPAEQGVYNRTTHSIEKHTVELAKYLAWKDDIILLDGQTLLETTRLLSRWYNVEFRFKSEAIKECTINGEFKSSSLENLLESIKFITGIDYRIGPSNEVVLDGLSCNPN